MPSIVKCWTHCMLSLHCLFNLARSYRTFYLIYMFLFYSWDTSILSCKILIVFRSTYTILNTYRRRNRLHSGAMR